MRNRSMTTTSTSGNVESSAPAATLRKRKWWLSLPIAGHLRQHSENRNETASVAGTTPRKLPTRLSTGRLLFISCLAGTAAGLGSAAHHYLSAAESDLGTHQFKSVAERALASARASTERKLMGGISLASITAGMNPTAAKWPNITFPNFEKITQDIEKTSDGRGLGVVVIVRPEQVSGFENFAREVFESNSDEWPKGIGTSSFGFGIYNNDASGSAYHDTNGTTTWNSAYKVLTPFFYVNKQGHHLVMFNYFQKEKRGRTMESIMDCATVEALRGSDEPSIRCDMITEPVVLLGQEPELGFGASIVGPIYPSRDRNTLTGFYVSSIQWFEVLEHSFPREVNGIDCVIETHGKSFSYKVINGEAVFVAEGDWHDTKHTHQGRSVQLTQPKDFGTDSTMYTLKLYPTNTFFEAYSTANPRVATLGAVLIIVFTSVLFFLYDFFVQKEFLHNQHLLEAKRRFMRFVSHEVRTPLNAIVMGMTLLQEEVAALSEQARFGNSSSQPTANDRCDESVGTNASSAVDVNELSQQILGSAESAVSVLNDLLNYDKIEMGQLSYEASIMPIWNVIHHTLMEFQPSATSREIDYMLDYSSLPGCDSSQSSREIIRFLPREVLELRAVGDKIRCVQVIRNLVSNAIKFTPPGGRIQITVSAIQSDAMTTFCERIDDLSLVNCAEPVYFDRWGLVQIKVEDNGVGMTRQQVRRLFRHGVQFNVNELQAGQGSGLGLYIAKGIVDQHRGQLSVCSDGLGKGSTFTLQLPLYHIPDESLPPSYEYLKFPDPVVPSPGEVDLEDGTLLIETLPDDATPDDLITKVSASDTSSHGSHRSKTEQVPMDILVVDDSSSNRKLLAHLLARQGHHCTQACDGIEAVAMVRDRLGNTSAVSLSAAEKGMLSEPAMFDCILLDYEMPNLNGPNAAKQMRDMGCQCLILGVTGNVLKEDIDIFTRCGANGVLAKPIEIPILKGIWRANGLGVREAPKLSETNSSDRALAA